ncbi:hypothetical protein EW145_g6980 [Phellinidium pouzarii]|uniref:Uncharacterized protein n=1 Tax=Phellinidium pouzarii TaxID=167371 RepID=A0A4S4KVL5_9AGAM|nr:hypothetical protein EW145_g6980 [Phellinidium pouzarii]
MALGPVDVLPATYNPFTKDISKSFDRHEQFKASLLRISPLVSIDRVKDQLLFIGAWLRFYQEAEEAGILNFVLARSVYRFELWLKHVVIERTGPLQPCELPPFDVAMMLHACMLSPRRHYEDGLVRFPQLLEIGAFPLENIAALIDSRTYIYTATTEQVKCWQERLGVPFDPLSYQEEVKDVTIRCPSCGEKLNVAWENNGCGYAESDFLCECLRCGLSVSHDRLCVAKFIKDLTNAYSSDQATLRGTLLNDRGEVVLARARLIALQVAKVLREEDGSLPALSETSMSVILQRLYDSVQTKAGQDRITELLRPYMQATSFTHDLAKAVPALRQFHLDLMATGICSPAFLSGHCNELSVAYKKYEAFLELIASPEGIESAVPSPDLDLVWHTHQLSGLSYK